MNEQKTDKTLTSKARSRWKRAKRDAVGNGETKLELVTQADANTEKLIQANVRTMRMAISGIRRSESLLYAYAAVCGAAANRLAGLIPARGGLLKLLAAAFPDVSENQLYVWRHFAEGLKPHLVITPMVGVIEAPVVGKRITIPVNKLEGFQAAIKQVLKGATMVEFHKASQFCGDVQADGGARNPNPSASHTPTAEEEIKNATAMIDAYKTQVQAMLDDRANFLKAKPSNIVALEDLRAELGRHIAAMQKERKA